MALTPDATNTALTLLGDVETASRQLSTMRAQQAGRLLRDLKALFEMDLNENETRLRIGTRVEPPPLGGRPVTPPPRFRY